MDTPVAQWIRARRGEAGGGDEGAGDMSEMDTEPRAK